MLAAFKARARLWIRPISNINSNNRPYYLDRLLQAASQTIVRYLIK